MVLYFVSENSVFCACMTFHLRRLRGESLCSHVWAIRSICSLDRQSAEVRYNGSPQEAGLTVLAEAASHGMCVCVCVCGGGGVFNR